MGRRTGLAIGLIGMLLLVVAAPASANWTHKGKGELTENASLTLTGELTLSTSAGNITCPTSMGVTLTKSSATGTMNTFSVSKPSECDLTGSLAAICGTHGVTKVEKTGTWNLAAEETDIKLSSIDVHYTFGGCLVPGVRLKGTSTLSVDKANSISTVTFSSTQTLYNALGEESGTGELKGTASVSPAGTYGIKPIPIETRWLDDNEHLSEEGSLTFSGNLLFSSSQGTVSCPISGSASLADGTVEEGDPEGKIETFTVSKPSECDVTGTLKTLCGTNSISSVEKTGTWNLTASEEDISISGMVLDYKFKECAVSSLRTEGVATLAVDDPTSIGEITFSASPSIYNASEEKIGTGEITGAQSVSPAGTYAIKEGAPPTEPTAGTWTVDGEEIGSNTESGSVIAGHGKVSLTYPLTGSNVHIGPCDVTLSVTIWNDSGLGSENEAHGEISEFATTTPCPISYMETTFCTVTSRSSSSFPWTISTEGTNVSIEGSKFTQIFSEGCVFGGGFSFEGSMTGIFKGSKIVFEEAPGLEKSGGGEPELLLNGFIELTDVTRHKSIEEG